MSKSRQLRIRPYARLLTMLGDQLIKNERIAINELVKNSYDADADWVKISFEGFGEEFETGDKSKIIIEDDGDGMTEETIEKHWLNPATPDKLIRKRKKSTTKKGRVIQGEKGIGRFAILKLGRHIEVTTRARGAKDEFTVNYDFSEYDDDFLYKNKKEKEIFLDQLGITMTMRTPKVMVERPIVLGKRKIDRKPHGTKIEITQLKGSWSEGKIESASTDLVRLMPLFKKADSSQNTGARRDKGNSQPKADFSIYFYKDEREVRLIEKRHEELLRLLDERSVFRIRDGRFDQKKGEFRFLLNDQPQVLRLNETKISGFTVFRRRFGKKGERLKARDGGVTSCGSFRFNFSIFDFSAQAPEKYKLDRPDKDLIKPHRIYLYRDNIRVYPYGEQDDDWLKIDTDRGTVAAKEFLSNDQIVGWVNISQSENPQLQDKTSREGLLDIEDATDDFVALIRSFLAWVRADPYKKYREDIKDRSAVAVYKEGIIQQKFNRLKELAHDKPKVVKLLKETERDYKKEREFLVQRAETTEELAGVGLSVETTSHDIMSIMSKSLNMIDGTIKDLLGKGEVDLDALQSELHTLRGMLSFVESQLQDIQVLFKSSKQRRRDIRVNDAIKKIRRIYDRILAEDRIDLTVEMTRLPLIAKTTDAVLLQLLINLFDNAIYWFQGHESKKKKIAITLNGDEGTLIFSDNGPGVRAEDAPYIFEPFFSGKGLEGRGLGLYIARQLLARYDYGIELANRKGDKILPGANFVVNFVPEEG